MSNNKISRNKIVDIDLCYNLDDFEGRNSVKKMTFNKRDI